MAPNDSRFREIVLYIAEKSEGDTTFGSAKLGKLLFYIDFYAYLLLGEPVTGQEYVRSEFGPAPRRLLALCDDMKTRGEIGIREKDYFGRIQLRVLALRSGDLCVFSAKEIELVDLCLQRFRNCPVSQVSELSNRLFKWHTIDDQATIPYEMALVARRDPTAQEFLKGKEVEAAAEEWLRGRVSA
ncbi:MAG: Panacea domain-containing protein [Candidatus Hydrogenedentota bacterium]